MCALAETEQVRIVSYIFTNELVNIWKFLKLNYLNKDDMPYPRVFIFR
jgi:hypothetical protein